MNKELYSFIVEKEHHKYRRVLDVDLAQEYSREAMSPIERMANRFELMCKEESAVILEGEQIVFLRTIAKLPDIFTDDEWDKIKSESRIHELGFMSNLSPNYYDTIATGLLARRECADEYGKRMIDNIIKLSDKYLDEAKKTGQRGFG